MDRTRSFIKGTLKVIMWVVIGFVLLFVIIAVLIQVPAVQNKIVRYATSFVSNKTHTRVEIKHISISFPKSVVIKGLFLDDLHKDTLIYAGEAKINIALKDLLRSKIDVFSIALQDMKLNLKRSATDSLFNYNFLLTAFSSAPVPKEQQTPSKWTFRIDNVSLKNVRLHMDDAYGGMKVAVDPGNMELKMDAMDLDKSIYRINKLLVENTNVTYRDQMSKQDITAVINRFELNAGSFNLQKEIITLDNLKLSRSAIRYSTVASTPIAVTSTIPATATKSWQVSVKNIDMNDNALAYRVGNLPAVKNAFDMNQLNYRHLILKAKNLYYSANQSSVSVKKFSATDQNNFAITRFETDFSMDQHSITAKNLKANTRGSSIDADLHLQYSSLAALKDSLPKLFMNLDLRKVSVINSDLFYFNPELSLRDYFKSKTNVTAISGKITGRVNDLTGKEVVIKTGAQSIIQSDFGIRGLPDMNKAFFYFPNLTVNSGKQDVEMFVGPSIPPSIALPATFNMVIAFKGRMKSFETTMGLNSTFGKAQISAILDQNENFRGKATMTSFDLGSLLKDKEMYGPVTLTAEANGHGLDMKTIRAKIKADVQQLYLKKYTYHNLKVDGEASAQGFEGKINLNDKNAVLDFDGLVNITPNQEHYKFRLNVESLDLLKLNLSTDSSRIGLVALVDLKADAAGKLSGKAGISKLMIAKGANKYLLDTLLQTSVNEPGKRDLNKSNALIGINYAGTTNPGDLTAALTQFINHYFPISDSLPKLTQSASPGFNFEMLIRYHPILSQALMPQLTDLEPTFIKGSFDGQKKELKLNATTKKVVYSGMEIDNLVMDVNSDATALNYKLSSSAIMNTQAKIDNFLLAGKLENNILYASVSSIEDNQSKKFVIHSQITKVKGNYKLALEPKEFYLMNNRWDISADNYIEFGKDGLLIHHFFINKGGSEINVASVHNKFNDDLNIGIKSFNLDDLSRIIEKDTSLVKGTVDGNVLLKRVNNSYGIIADAKISNLIVRDVPVGNLSLKASNPKAEQFDVEVDLSGAGNNLTAKGFYIPNGGANSINIKTDIQSLSMKTVQAFSMGQIKEASGTITGNILAMGVSTSPDITGELAFKEVFIKPAVLNNTLELKNESIQLKNDGLYLKSFTLLDVDKHEAVIDGTVKMKQFSNFIYNLHVNSKDFLLFNSTAKDNKVFFGRMVIDSKIDVNGPMSLPVISGRVKMKKGSNFTFAVPADELTSDKGEDVVEFESLSKADSILAKTKKLAQQKSGFSGFDLSSIIEVDKEATLKLLMDPTSTDSLVVKGQAALSLTMDRSGKMSLTGAYNLTEGSYLVSLESVIKRKFAIDPGSTIIWNGDPMDAEISIDATYAVQATPYDLVAVQMSGLSDIEKGGYKQKYPFLVLLKLRGEILHPVISFQIQLKPEDKGILGGAVNQKLNMLNEDASELNKQVFALLVLGRFVQENPFTTESGGTSTMVRSTVGNFLSAQLNKLSSKYIPGVELNFDVNSYNDYQTGTAQGRTQVAIGVKKQLFNERLSVQLGGNVDVEGERTKQNSASNITSDVAVEYKLTTDGRFLLKGFRQNLYEGAIEGQLVETGFGVVYKHDFNKWKEFFKAQSKKSSVLKK